LKTGKNAFLIQARLGSARLPAKMVLPFYEGHSILELLIDKLKDYFRDIPAILATSINPANDLLENVAKEKGIYCFRGSEEDVLQRFIDAAHLFGVEQIIRVCADNPFLDITELQWLMRFVDSNNFDYVSFKFNGLPCIKTHFGFWAEAVKVNALCKVQQMTNVSLYHEHVTNFIYENPTFFSIHFLEPNDKLQNHNNIRMTLDTIEDFRNLSEIYASLRNIYGESFGIDEIIKFLNENPHYKDLMEEEIKRNVK
jgi:spore coat polysaccharide biosynthesis protein SpsF